MRNTELLAVLRSCTEAERLDILGCQIEFLCHRADRLPDCACRRRLIERIATLNVAYLLAL